MTAELGITSGVLRGEVTEVIEPSPDRVDPPEHPGLDFGHIAYPRQLELKREVVVDALRRAARSSMAGAAGSQRLAELLDGAAGLIEPVVASPRVWGYRSAVQPAVTRAGLGYRRPGSREAVALERDPTANEAVAAAWEIVARNPPPGGVREAAFRGNDEGEALLALVATLPARELLDYAHGLVSAGITGVALAPFDPRGRFRSGSERLAGRRRILQRYGSVDLSVTATGFAQPNPAAASALYEAVAALPGGGHAADLFAGGGGLSFHLAGAFERVTAFEIDRSSVERGRQDAERLGVRGVEFVRVDARRVRLPEDAELVAVDPPRAGLGSEVRDLIHASSARRLVYVSCDPATWARDVSDFAGRGWRVEFARPYDFFPHTHHVETLSLLAR